MKWTAELRRIKENLVRLKKVEHHRIEFNPHFVQRVTISFLTFVNIGIVSCI